MLKHLSWYSQHPYYDTEISLALGSFDAIHYGHQSLLQQRFSNLEPWVLYFRQAAHVEQLPSFKPMVRSEQQRLEIFKHQQLHGSYALDFSAEISTMSGISFMDALIQKICIKAIVVGEDFRFGHKAQTSAMQLKEWAEQRGIMVQILPIVANEMDDVKYSSSRLRQAIMSGQFNLVSEASGYGYAIDLRGMPVLLNGKRWQYNLERSVQILPESGTYQDRAGNSIYIKDKKVSSTTWLEQVYL